jgi:pimeloyl-ACP methyl ester carboxylesterase
VTPGGTLRRAATIVAVASVIVALVGATVQGVATALERRRYQRPGRMVDVGGHQLHVACVGTGAARVLLEAPLGGLSATWAPVQAAIGQRVRVCSYDRSGLGWSESGEGPFDVARSLLDLRAVLASIEATSPVVLVGDGFGAGLVARFAREHPDETSGLVLISMPTQGSRPPPTRSPWLARVGELRARDWLTAPGESADGGGAARVVRAFGYRPDHLARVASEARAWAEVAGSAPDPLPDLPTRRLDALSNAEAESVSRIADAVSSVLAETDRRLQAPR